MCACVSVSSSRALEQTAVASTHRVPNSLLGPDVVMDHSGWSTRLSRTDPVRPRATARTMSRRAPAELAQRGITVMAYLTKRVRETEWKEYERMEVSESEQLRKWKRVVR